MLLQVKTGANVLFHLPLQIAIQSGIFGHFTKFYFLTTIIKNTKEIVECNGNKANILTVQQSCS